MKALLDSCVWGGALDVSAEAGIDVVSVRQWAGDPGDSTILAVAYEQGRVLVTLDKDFGELAIVREAPHAGIVRIVGLKAREQGPTIVEALANMTPICSMGSFSRSMPLA